MPLEIRELTIKVNVTAQPSPGGEADVYTALRNVREEWIEKCAEKVLHKIEKMQDR